MDIIFYIKAADSDEKIPAARREIEICKTVKDMVEDTDDGEIIPINQKLEDLKLVVKYCKYYKGSPPDEDHYTRDDLNDFEIEFIKSMSHKRLLELIKCASFLQNTPLINCCFRGLVDKARGKDTNEFKNICCVPSDVTVE